MYLRTRELLTPEQRKEFTCLSENMSDWEVSQYYSFSNEDIKIINRHRRDHNKLGFAVQLSMLRFPGWALTPDADIPNNILTYIADQINVSIKEYTKYFNREATRHEHLEELRQLYGYTNFNETKNLWLIKKIKKHALESGNSNHLIKQAIDYLRKSYITSYINY